MPEMIEMERACAGGRRHESCARSERHACKAVPFACSVHPNRAALLSVARGGAARGEARAAPWPGLRQATYFW